MKKLTWLVLTVLILLPVLVFAQGYDNPDGSIKVALVINQYSGSRSGPELSPGPEALLNGGIREILDKLNCKIKNVSKVKLTPGEEKEYGEWNRLGLANGHLAEITAKNEKDGLLNVGFLANCNSLMGMLGGLQHSGKGRKPLKIGLVWIDAHGDFNTPETTLSGMLGGMPVAVSAGLCLSRLRLKSGLDPALPPKYITMAGVRDTDPLEQEQIDRYNIKQISVEDIRNLSENIHIQMKLLSQITDKIYIHIDMDVLDPAEVGGHSLNVPDGPTSRELAAALSLMFKYEKTAGLGIASYPADRDEEKISLKAAYNLVEGAVNGVKER